MFVPHVGLLAGGPELLCDPECLWRETNLRGDRRSEIKKNNILSHHSTKRRGRFTEEVSGQTRLPRLTSYLSINQRSEWQVVEQVCEVLPDVGVAVLPQALVVEAVDLRDLPRLVVPSQDGDSFLETNLNDTTIKKVLITGLRLFSFGTGTISR